MQAILRKINKIPGVRGTMILGEDGFIVASDLSGNDDPNALGAVASTVASTVNGALERMRHGRLARFVMNGSRGGLVLQPVQSLVLLTLVSKDANMGMVLVELKNAAGELVETLAREQPPAGSAMQS